MKKDLMIIRNLLEISRTEVLINPIPKEKEIEMFFSISFKNSFLYCIAVGVQCKLTPTFYLQIFNYSRLIAININFTIAR